MSIDREPVSLSLARFVHGLELATVPADARRHIVRAFTDTLGCAVAGLRAEPAKIGIELARGERGSLEATVVGGGPASLLACVFANTVTANALDFEPVGPEGHVTLVAIPAALAVAEATGASGAELMTALAAGVEVGGRLGAAIRRSTAPDAPQLVDGNAFCAFAGVAAAGKLLALGPDELHHAFGIAGYAAAVPTLHKFMNADQAPMTKYDYLAVTAQNSVQAARLAQRGFTGDLDVLEGANGFWRLSGGNGYNSAVLLDDLGEQWSTGQTQFKRYPANLYTQPAIAVVRDMIDAGRFTLESIESVVIEASRVGRLELKRDPDAAHQAWASYAYAVAAGLCDLSPRYAWFDPATFADPRLNEMRRRITVTPLTDPQLLTGGHHWEGWAPVRVTVRAGGDIFEGSATHLPPLDDNALETKFLENTTSSIGTGQARALFEASWNLHNLPAVRELTGLLPSHLPS